MSAPPALTSLRPAEIPVVETPRLRLRPHRREDFPACVALWADPLVTRYIGGKPLTREEVWARFLRYAGGWYWLGFGYWAVEEIPSGQFIGELGYSQNERSFDPPSALLDDGGLTMPEVGWVLAPQFHGRGYATEAALAALAWGDARIAVPHSFCIIHPDHRASIRVAEKCGFVEQSRPFYRTEPTILFTRRRTATQP
ncbi:MAG TPA: GNAT family N-acetyltransferase [Candidatus Acidoferrum sp.]|nr:GNAT family N-acetyltransferase [Candidatus Acidoferrum sp.]